MTELIEWLVGSASGTTEPVADRQFSLSDCGAEWLRELQKCDVL